MYLSIINILYYNACFSTISLYVYKLYVHVYLLKYLSILFMFRERLCLCISGGRILCTVLHQYFVSAVHQVNILYAVLNQPCQCSTLGKYPVHRTSSGSCQCSTRGKYPVHRTTSVPIICTIHQVNSPCSSYILYSNLSEIMIMHNLSVTC